MHTLEDVPSPERLELNDLGVVTAPARRAAGGRPVRPQPRHRVVHPRSTRRRTTRSAPAWCSTPRELTGRRTLPRPGGDRLASAALQPDGDRGRGRARGRDQALTGPGRSSCGAPPVTWQFSLAGLLVGLLVGMTGMGGGSLMTPILILFFGFDAKVAVGTDILHGAIFKSFGAVAPSDARHRARAARALDAARVGAAVARRRRAGELGRRQRHDRCSQQRRRAALVVGGIGFLVEDVRQGARATTRRSCSAPGTR